MLVVAPFVGYCVCSMFCCSLLSVNFSFVIILMGKRKLVALLCLASCYLVIIFFLWLFLTVPCVDLQCIF